MAYNILKGTVEFTGDNGSLENTVDLATDQTVAGGKTFSQRITASAITLGGTALSHPSITALSNGAAYRVSLFDASSPTTTLSGNANLTFRYGALTSSYFTGSGAGLTSLQAQEIVGKLSASQVNIGNGLKASGYNIVASASHAITVSATGISVNVIAAGGLAITSSNGLAVDPQNALDITTSGQSLADADTFIAHDASRGKIVKADALDIYNYVNGKISSPVITTYNNASSGRVITSVNGSTVNGEANLTFIGSKLSVTGQLSASLGVTGSSITTADGILTILNDSGNAKIKTTANHLLLKNSATNKDIRIQLGDDAGATKFQVRNNSNVKAAQIDSMGSASFNDLSIAGNSFLSGGIRKHYVYTTGNSNYSLTGSDHIVIFNKGAVTTASLPPLNIDLNGIGYVIKNIGASAVHVTSSAGPDADAFIDGQQSKTLTQGDSITLLGFYGNSGYEWAVLSYYNV